MANETKATTEATTERDAAPWAPSSAGEASEGSGSPDDFTPELEAVDVPDEPADEPAGPGPGGAPLQEIDPELRALVKETVAMGWLTVDVFAQRLDPRLAQEDAEREQLVALWTPLALRYADRMGGGLMFLMALAGTTGVYAPKLRELQEAADRDDDDE